MHFKSFLDFLQMGGYAFYVWSAYGIVFIFLCINFFIPVFAKKKFFEKDKSKID